MIKFSNVDVIDALNAIMKQNTGFNQDQFQHDQQTIKEAATSTSRDNKTLLWVSAPSGTYCETEKALLIWENLEYGMFSSFADSARLDGDKILCYAIKLTGMKDSKITGDLYPLDYMEHLVHLYHVALPATTVTITDRDKTIRHFPYKEYKENERQILRRFGPCHSFSYESKNKLMLTRLLYLEQKNRERDIHLASLQAHVRQLATEKVTDEALRLISEFGQLWNPNGGDARFMVNVSPIFLNLATKDEVKQLATILPYKSLSITHRDDGIPGLFAFISQDDKLAYYYLSEHLKQRLNLEAKPSKKKERKNEL